ncbi:unnamed protein product [Trichogramma brassicae]|uniref:Uncharacterized protein n=1 Tax=Trichogramma brassicae TaxID=86971 RepID=A0A6H5HWN5_9HYME|nr:unnamed protein product [Trichogramma brassicae]
MSAVLLFYALVHNLCFANQLMRLREEDILLVTTLVSERETEPSTATFYNPSSFERAGNDYSTACVMIPTAVPEDFSPGTGWLAAGPGDGCWLLLACSSVGSLQQDRRRRKMSFHPGILSAAVSRMARSRSPQARPHDPRAHTHTPLDRGLSDHSRGNTQNTCGSDVGSPRTTSCSYLLKSHSHTCTTKYSADSRDSTSQNIGPCRLPVQSRTAVISFDYTRVRIPMRSARILFYTMAMKAIVAKFSGAWGKIPTASLKRQETREIFRDAAQPSLIKQSSESSRIASEKWRGSKLCSQNGDVPLHIICESFDDSDDVTTTTTTTDIANMLLRSATKKTSDRRGQRAGQGGSDTRCTRSIFNSNINMIEVLLRRGANPNSADKSGHTPRCILYV